MRVTRCAVLLGIISLGALQIGACTPTEAPADGETEGSGEATGQEATGAETAPEATADAPPVETGPVADTFVDGLITSDRFNIRFRVPEGWGPSGDGDLANGPFGVGTSEDSLTLLGPDNSSVHMIVANSESIQLVGSSFDNLDERVGFQSVNIVPERSRGGSFNGVPGYRTEGDALLRGDAVPIAFISQALELPGNPTMATIFINYDMYSACYGEVAGADEEVPAPGSGEAAGEEEELAPLAQDCADGYYSDVMNSVLDSIEVIDLQRTP